VNSDLLTEYKAQIDRIPPANRKIIESYVSAAIAEAKAAANSDTPADDDKEGSDMELTVKQRALLKAAEEAEQKAAAEQTQFDAIMAKPANQLTAEERAVLRRVLSESGW
jgi:hypothetical protein